MSAVGDRSEFKIQDGKIYRWMEGRSYYDVDWGMCYERGYYYVVADDNARGAKCNTPSHLDRLAFDDKGVAWRVVGVAASVTRRRTVVGGSM